MALLRGWLRRRRMARVGAAGAHRPRVVRSLVDEPTREIVTLLAVPGAARLARRWHTVERTTAHRWPIN
jgi:hypothetical protein